MQRDLHVPANDEHGWDWTEPKATPVAAADTPTADAAEGGAAAASAEAGGPGAADTQAEEQQKQPLQQQQQQQQQQHEEETAHQQAMVAAQKDGNAALHGLGHATAAASGASPCEKGLGVAGAYDTSGCMRTPE